MTSMHSRCTDKNNVHTCRQLKGSLIGSNRQKHIIVEKGILPRLINLLGNQESPCELQVAVAQTLGSVAKGMETHLKALVDGGVVPVLLGCLLRSDHPRLVEACLCCLKTVFLHPEVCIVSHNTDILNHNTTEKKITNFNVLIFCCSILKPDPG